MPTRYEPRNDRGYEDTLAHYAAVEAILRPLNPTHLGDLATRVIEADPYPRDGIYPHLSRALDDIFTLRQCLAFEARVLEAHYEGTASFPKTRLRIAEPSVQQLRDAARGHHADVLTTLGSKPDPEHPSFRLSAVKVGYKTLGLDSGLTNAQYEAEQPIAAPNADDRRSQLLTPLREYGKDGEEAASRIAHLPAAERTTTFGDAVTEVYSLRGLAAWNAALLDGHLAMATFPKSRRPHAQAQRERLAALAAGQRVDYYGVGGLSFQRSLVSIDAPQSLSLASYAASIEAAAA